MEFSFETNGSNTFLVYKIRPEDRLDTMTLGMITNNRILGLAPALYTQMNTERFLKYNVTARVTIKQFLTGVVNRRKLLGIFSSIAATLSAVEDYMIDQNTLLMDMDWIYADVTSCTAEMICLPVTTETDLLDAGQFFKNIMFTTQFDQTEDCGYVARIISFLNSVPVFVAEDFRGMLTELEKSAVELHMQSQHVITEEVRPAHQPAFWSVGQTQQPSVGQDVPPQREISQAQPEEMPAVELPPVELPSQGESQVKEEQNKEKQGKDDQTQEKSMSVLYLLQHYNKENAAAYKAQKQAKKHVRKAESNSGKKQDISFGFSVPGQPSSQMQPAAQIKVQQAENDSLRRSEQIKVKEPVIERKDLPAGENFGETVMADANPFGEDTVVLVNTQINTFKPYLIRCSNQEKILLTKPVFHIGKERSYVDYCISGNTTVSRSHADIIQKGDQCYIVDNNSTNHTFVNEEMIPSNTEVPLTHGMKIRLSNEEFEFKTS